MTHDSQHLGIDPALDLSCHLPVIFVSPVAFVALALVDALPESALVHLLRDVDVRVDHGDLDDVAVGHRDLDAARGVPGKSRVGVPTVGNFSFREGVAEWRYGGGVLVPFASCQK